jgi:hypothetical protein
LTESLERLHGCLVIEPVSLEITPIKPLEVRRKGEALPDEEHDLLPVESHLGLT